MDILLLQIWNITELLKHIYHRTEQYERFNWAYYSNNNSSVSPDDNSTAEEDSDYWSDIERIPVMSGKCLKLNHRPNLFLI